MASGRHGVGVLPALRAARSGLVERLGRWLRSAPAISAVGSRRTALVRALGTALLVGAGVAGLAGCDGSARELLLRGNSALAEEDWAAARTAYEAAAEAAPERPEPRYNAALAHYRQEDVNGAIRLLEQALLLDRDGRLAAWAYYNLGNTLLNAERFEEAVAAYEEALRLTPGDEDTKHNLELALLRRDQQQQEQQQQQQQDQEQQEGQQQEQQAGEGQQEDQSSQGEQDQQGEGEQQEAGESSSGEEQQDGQEGRSAAEDGAEGERDDEATAGGRGQRTEGMTPEQARQLLRSLSRGSATLGELLRERYVVPGAPPERDW